MLKLTTRNRTIIFWNIFLKLKIFVLNLFNTIFASNISHINSLAGPARAYIACWPLTSILLVCIPWCYSCDFNLKYNFADKSSWVLLCGFIPNWPGKSLIFYSSQKQTRKKKHCLLCTSISFKNRSYLLWVSPRIAKCNEQTHCSLLGAPGDEIPNRSSHCASHYIYSMANSIK